MRGGNSFLAFLEKVILFKKLYLYDMLTYPPTMFSCVRQARAVKGLLGMQQKNGSKSVTQVAIFWHRSWLHPLIENFVPYLKRCIKAILWDRAEALFLNHILVPSTNPLITAIYQNCGFHFVGHKIVFTAFWTKI